jgi:murein DD-endopeptidase MepM/ murein hydrolase activator NlpD
MLGAATADLACPHCSGPVDVKSRHVAVAGSIVRVYCSDECLRGTGELTAEIEIEEPRRRRGWLVAVGLAVGSAGLGGYYWLDQDQPANDPPPIVAHAAPAVAAPPPPAPPAPPEISEQQREDEALINDLMHDAWIHPLAGPHRRMPINHTAAFGADRPGTRPPECVSGHCGVDVGNTWGEPVHAVHDGVVDWVNRGPNEGHGGIFVKLAHRGGALYSWYFHLAAVPRWIQPGVKVSAGQVIGLLGDTDVARSGPHLHFALSVKASKNTERYLDPEPLIAIWPLWIADDGNGHLSTVPPPGLPVRAEDHWKPRPAEPHRSGSAVEETSNEAAPPATDPPKRGANAQELSLPAAMPP